MLSRQNGDGYVKRIKMKDNTTKFIWDGDNCVGKYTELIEQYHYDSEEEKMEHKIEMELNGWNDSGQAMTVFFEFEEDRERSWSSFKYATIDFTVDEEKQQEELSRKIRLSKWNGDRKDGWEIRVDTNPNLNSLRNLDEFDLLLLKLQRADVRIIADELSDEDYVYSDTKPEPTYE